MTTSYATFVTRLRIDLHDEDATAYRWTDAHLQRHVDQAVRDYQAIAPQRIRTTKATTSGSRDITLDAATFPSMLTVVQVEYPTGKYPKEFTPFGIWGTTLTLLTDRMPSADNAIIDWQKAHLVDATSSTIPAEHEDIIALGATAYAAQELQTLAVSTVNLDPAATTHYATLAATAMKQFFTALDRLRRRALRVRQSYSQVTTGLSKSQTTDWGP